MASENNFKKEVGARIKAIRDSLNLSREKMDQNVQVALSSLHNYERGISEAPLKLIVNLVKVYKVNLLFLIFGQGAMFMEERDSSSLSDDQKEFTEIFLQLYRDSKIYRKYMEGYHEILMINT